ncbi:hypothetical protein C8Q80DRAFT_1220221 [Daedaleopsis nitida]|nr:hypothetical protein C8Q80DRAFT_1220221 [Daedaleopsis nitida]
MGLLALALPSLLLGRRARKHTKSYDAEKAIPQASDSRPIQDEIDHDDSDDDHGHSCQDVLTSNTPRRTIRRIRPHVAPTKLMHANSSTHDLRPPGPSLYSRLKSYVWPSGDQLADIDTFVPNYRWTPILSGIVIPFSILLEIPGLTVRWYIRTEGNTTVETRPNPIVLDVGMAISIACALIANVCLVLRFLEKRVQTVTLLCIVFLTIHDLINIVAVTVFGVEHRFDDGFTYGEAFWLTLCSTIASTTANVSLIVDLIRTPDFAKRGSGLTNRQRALMIIVIVLLAYIALGALVNSYLLHLSFVDGLYFTVVSIETIGFGDVSPNPPARAIGVTIAMCRETVLEGLEIGYRRRMRDMRQRRREARRFRRWEARWQRAIEFRLREAGEPIWVPDEDRPSRMPKKDGLLGLVSGVKMPFYKRVGTTVKRSATMTSVKSMESVFGGHRKHHLNVDALTTAQLEEAALEAGVPLEMFLDVGDHDRQPGDDDHGRGHEGNQTSGIPAGVQSNDGIVPALAQTQAVNAFRDTIASGWPSHPQTPTHAQLGRMSAMLTKFSIAVAGTHVGACTPTGDGGDSTSSDQQQQPQEEAGEESRPRPGRGKSFTDIRQHPTAKWLKEFARGAQSRSVWSYEQFKTEMEAEEKKAYYVKLTIAWVLFFLFWTIGSGIFCVTEGWSYGTAIYFCLVAFSTTGYGDFSPQTPAGRSVFVVWALFGVGTLTILVAVLQEAGSSRYKSALHSRVFDKAVKKYRKKQVQEIKQRPRPIIRKDSSGASKLSATAQSTNSAGSSSSHNASRPTVERYREAQAVAHRALEALPTEVVKMSRTFQEHMQFFVSGRADGLTALDDIEGDPEGDPSLKVPPEMQKLLDELGSFETISERVKADILQDEDARKTLFMLTLERSLKHLVASAEAALSSLADRDALATMAAEDQKPSPLHRRSTFSVTSSPDTVTQGNNDRDHLRARSQPSLPSSPRSEQHQLHVKHMHARWRQTQEASVSEVPRAEASQASHVPAPRYVDGDTSSSSSITGS